MSFFLVLNAFHIKTFRRVLEINIHPFKNSPTANIILIFNIYLKFLVYLVIHTHAYVIKNDIKKREYKSHLHTLFIPQTFDLNNIFVVIFFFLSYLFFLMNININKKIFCPYFILFIQPHSYRHVQNASRQRKRHKNPLKCVCTATSFEWSVLVPL